MNTIKKQIGAIIFDMDGTIIQSNQSWSHSIAKTLSKHGIQKELIEEKMQEINQELTGIDAEACIRYLHKIFAIKDTGENLKNDLLYFFEEQASDAPEYISGFTDFHEKLRKNKIPSCIATNSYRSYFEKIQQKMNLKSFFGNHLYCIEDVALKGKPSPDLFLFAAKKLGVKPSQCLVFEDSRYGFMAANAAGMKCIAIQNDVNEFWRDTVHASITSYDEAVAAIKQILAL